MLIKTYGSAVQGVDARTITIEINTGGHVILTGNFYHLVGLPDNAVREGFARIEAAISNVGCRMHRYKTTVNLAPADLRKEGSAYDLPIAVAYLAATDQLPSDDLNRYVIMGELGLGGTLRPIRGALPMAIQARKKGFKGILLPKMNAREAAIVNDLDVYGISSLEEAIQFFRQEKKLEPVVLETREEFFSNRNEYDIDFQDVRGQAYAKRALELAAAGGHNALMIGPPGSGKTMLSRRLPTILPPLDLQEALETTKIHSVAGLLAPDASLVTTRPFRSPHHTISDVALVGGGSNPLPGEISLSHNGVLFLDELPEFKRSALEVLRQPMEERRVTISRARISVNYPASFMLVASMNPCPCGYYNHPKKDCVCGPGIVKRYLNRISGPLMDRIDLHVEVVPVSYEELADWTPSDVRSDVIAQRVIAARERQRKRFEDYPLIFANAQMPAHLVRQFCPIDHAGRTLIKTAMEKLKLSARAYDRILKVARTAADLNDTHKITVQHIAEAIHYRTLDREGWAEAGHRVSSGAHG